MPRLRPPLRNPAQRFSPLLAPLILATRSLASAQSELRWLAAHARSSATPTQPWPRLLRRYILRRARHEPLQYILGSEFFGPLEIRCRKGVLIPRQDTAGIVSHLASRLDPGREWRILDLCTGSGAIALLLAHLLPKAQVLGVDVSPAALELARENLALNHATGVDFVKGDVLAGLDLDGRWDVLVANPPYISPKDLRDVTAKSVRRHEPLLALAGGEDGDVFYPALLREAKRLGVGKLLMEVGDAAQGVRVARLAAGEWKVELWRDVPEGKSEEVTAGFTVRGEGNVRGVYCVREGEGQWM